MRSIDRRCMNTTPTVETVRGDMTYQIAEKFKSIQGEGRYAGTPMAFIRFVGCSVGKKICHFCDTDFDKSNTWLGGGEFDEVDLIQWIGGHTHVCLTGGEPFDQPELKPLFRAFVDKGFYTHIETSGTVKPDWLPPLKDTIEPMFICVSPKPGFLSEMIERADEVKVIVPGLGNGQGWPTVSDAVRWANNGKIVYLQPRNGKYDIDVNNMNLCEGLVQEHPNLRLSVQLHKILRKR